MRALCAALLAEQTRTNFALIAADGDVRAAEALDGRTIVLRNGKIVEEGMVARLSGPSAHNYTQSYFTAGLKLDPEKAHRAIARGESLLQVQGLQIAPPAPGTKPDTLSFELRRGAALALIGEEGSGRRNMVRAVLGLDRLEAKRILFDAVDLNILSPAMALRLRRRVAFITGSDDTLDPRMTIWDTIDEPLRSHLGLSRDMLHGHREAALKRVGLASLAGNRPVASLSAFDRRRLQIARAIVATPLLTVVDEPLRGLDGFAPNVIRELLVDFRAQEGPAFFVITSDFAIAQALADDAMVFKDRSVIERGPIREMLKSPKDAHTKALVQAAQPALLQPAAEG
jgi:peptide/nickel transport system ATP-binding protein